MLVENVIGSILTHWPTPVGIIVIAAIAIFRKSIARLLDRSTSVRAGGLTIDATSNQKAEEQSTLAPIPAAAAAVAASSDLVANPPSSPPEPFPPQPLIQFESSLVKDISEAITRSLSGTTDASVRERRLIEIGSQAFASGMYEHIYAEIYGSQLALLRDLNGVRSASLVEVKEGYFDVGKSRFPALYESDTFERWLAWLIFRNYLVERTEDDRVTISRFGRDFLQYVVANGYPLSKSS